MNYGYYVKGRSEMENWDTYYDVYCYVPDDEKIFCDEIGSSKNLDYLLDIMGEGDSLHLTNLFDLGRSWDKVIKALYILNDNNIRLFVMNDEVNLDDVIYAITGAEVA